MIKDCCKKKKENKKENGDESNKKIYNMFYFFSKKLFKLQLFKKIKSKTINEAAALLLIIIIISGAAVFYCQKKYDDKYFAGSILASVHLGNKTPDEAKKIIKKKVDDINQHGITINYLDEKFQLMASPIAADPDITFDLFSINDNEKLEEMFIVGRGNKNLFLNLRNQIFLFIFSKNQPIDYYLNEKQARQLLINNFGHFEQKAIDAQIIVEDGEYNIQHEQHGKIFNYDEIIEQIKARLAYLDDSPITLSLKTAYPQVYKEQIEPLLPQAEKIIQLAPLKLITADNEEFEKKEWIISKDQLATWLSAKKNSNGKKIIIGLKQDLFEKFLEETAAKEINHEPIDAKFKIRDGRVEEFVSSQPGQSIDIEETFKNLENKLIELSEKEPASSPEIKIVIKEVQSAISNKEVNNLGIKDLIGTGYSNFAGSPANRRHNIRVGADTLNGILIKPDEEFSLIKALGEINASTGYLPELVIKDNKTIPEYGGGLCQIGTTAFRTALATGLPITERRNHSYRVSYYEPAGTDATIYDPAPDFRFINDTDQYILIQTRIEGNDLYFDFWGTDDNRIITQTKPKIYNITLPPPTKIIKTNELEPGKKKCTESAHNGADASFYYKVEYADGQIKEETFSSHYRPWQEVCLVGQATSTPEILESKEIEKIFPE